MYSGSSAYSSLVALNDTAVAVLYERDSYSKISFAVYDFSHLKL